MSTSTSDNVEHYIDRDSFTRFQVLAVSLCALINIFDGFDVLAIAYAAPAISATSRLVLFPPTKDYAFPCP